MEPFTPGDFVSKWTEITYILFLQNFQESFKLETQNNFARPTVATLILIQSLFEPDLKLTNCLGGISGIVLMIA